MNILKNIWRRFCLFYTENVLGADLIILLVQNQIIFAIMGVSWLTFVGALVIGFATMRVVKTLAGETMKQMIAESYGVKVEELEAFLQKKFANKETEDGSK